MVTAEFDETANTLSLKVGGTMLVHDLQEIQGEVLCGLPKGGAATVDLSEVAEMDSAGVQLLYAIKRRVELDGGAFAVGAMSVPVRDFLAVYRLLELFGPAG
jgi:anti-sigma B factor antagonist